MPASRLFRGWAGGLSFPSAANTGPVTIPTQVAGDGTGGTIANPSSNPALYGTGWVYSASGGAHLNVTGSNAVISNLIIPFTINLSAPAGTLIHDCIITIPGAATGQGYGIQLRHTTGGVTIQDCTVSGSDPGPNRVGYAIDSIFGDDVNVLVQRCNIYWFRVGINTPNTGTGTVVRHNYIHDPGFISGDHTECVTTGQGTAGWLFDHNTMLVNLTQTAALPVGTGNAPTSGVTITNNLLAGGDYAVYASSGSSDSPSGIVITNNYFSTMFFPDGGFFGPVTDWFGGGPQAIAVTVANPAVFTMTVTGSPLSAQFAAGQQAFLAGTVPSGFTAAVPYYVVNPNLTGATFTFGLDTTSGGPGIAATTSGSGVTIAGYGCVWANNTWYDGPNAGTIIPS